MNNIKPILSNASSSNVFFVRNMCLNGDVLMGIDQKPFQGKINYDYIMWIDSDQVFSIQAFRIIIEFKQGYSEWILHDEKLHTFCCCTTNE